MSEQDLKCTECGLLWPPARVTSFEEYYGIQILVPIDVVRCVGCKTDYPRLLTAEQIFDKFKYIRDEVKRSDKRKEILLSLAQQIANEGIDCEKVN